MRHLLTVCLLVAATSFVLVPDTTSASLRERVLQRRQSEGEAGAPETATVSSVQGQQSSSSQQPPRLYPDLPRQPDSFAPPFGAHHYPPNHGPTPFVPFGIGLPTNRLHEPMQPWPPQQQQPRPKSPAERAQSMTFTSGLGRRLLAMVGIDLPVANNETQVEGAQTQRPSPDATMRALQNATVLQHLNRGIHSIYGSVSKMYNSTVQEQLNMLQERFMRETANSSTPWQQRMAQQVPQFFKSVAARVGEAQENLNLAWRQLAQANSGNSTERSSTMPNSQQQQGPPPRNFFSSIDQLFGNGPQNGDGTHQSGNFFSQIGRTLGMNGEPHFGGPNEPAQRDLTSQLMDLWHNQVQPQIGHIRGQIMNVWRDLTSTGVYTPEPVFRSRSNPINLGSAPSDSALPEMVEDALKEVNMNNPEYTLIDSQDNQQSGVRPGVSSHIQNRLIGMQRDLNQLWGGLSKSLQNAINNVQSAMNPKPRSNAIDTSASNANKQESDPEENKIDGTIKDLSKLQREADTVYDVVQQQQNQRPGLGDRFKNFFNNMDFIDIDRVGDQVTRFGTAVGDLWNQIPRRWDDFMQNSRVRDQSNNGLNGRLAVSSTTEKPEVAAQAN